MVDQDREMEIIALLSNTMEGYTYVESNTDVVDHHCEKTGEQTRIELIDVEYFRDGKYKEDSANFCDHCRQVFVFKSQ